MQNPIPSEERSNARMLIDHDIFKFLQGQMGEMGIMRISDSKAVRKKSSDHFEIYTGMVKWGLKAMSAMLSPTAWYSNIDEDKDFLKRSHSYFFGSDPLYDMSFDDHIPEGLYSHMGLLTMALYNLNKNPLGFAKKIATTATPFKGDLEELVFVPKGVSTSGEFIQFSVTDDGPGFSDKTPIKDRFSVPTHIGIRGNGLRVARYAAVYLHGSISVHSEPGNTSVTLNHPVNLGEYDKKEVASVEDLITK